MRAPGPTEPRSFFAFGFGGGGGGDETVPTVKLPCMIDGCASQTYLYVPSVNVTVHVAEPTDSTSVAWLTPGPGRAKVSEAAAASSARDRRRDIVRFILSNWVRPGYEQTHGPVL